MSAIFGETLLFRQNGGEPVELVVFGDEFYARYETTKGYTVVYDTDMGKYCYAIVMDGRFASSGAPLTKPAPPGLRKHLKESAEVRNRKFHEKFARMATPEPYGAHHFLKTFGANEGLLPGRCVSAGKVKGLTILVEFNDVTATVTAEDVHALLNADRYDRNGNFCSVREYFLLMSGGKLDYSNHVVGPIKLSRDQAYYQTHSLVPEALQTAVQQHHLDLTQFDSRNEGIVDALNFMYAGRTVYEGELWPHNWHFDLTFNGMKTHFYMLTSMGRHPIDLTIGTFCHENGHQLCRFPDLYDYGTQDGDFEKSQGIGCYCLMGSGNHNNDGRTPSPVCAYLRYLARWHEEELILNSQAQYEARHGNYRTVLKYETDNPNEFFLVENRTQLGLDQHLPSSGLSVCHCDTLGSNEWQGGSQERHYQCGLLQADGHLDLENNRNRGDVGDLFAENDGVALSDTTTPSSRGWDGTDSGLIISSISKPGEIVSFRVGQGPAALMASAELRADKLIPDSEPQGIRSEMEIGEVGRVQEIGVSVDISHTYIGDLQVELETPSGAKALLHDRAGEHKDDLRETYRSSAVKALANLKGEAINGKWKLNIRDLVRQDTGRLNWWRIELEYEASAQIAEGEANPNAKIPDNDPKGLDSGIPIAASGRLTGISVNVDIAHTYIGDLVVEILAPSGKSAVLHSRSGESKDNLKMSYSKESTAILEMLVGEEIKGNWTLSVRDLAAADDGTLNHWSLRISYD
jgi:M6 family metalloprotease-like protein